MAAAHLYALTEPEFTHLLSTCPLVPAPVKVAALAAFRAGPGVISRRNPGLAGRSSRTSVFHMSKAEIVAELPQLSPAEREEIRLKLAELDGHEWMDEADPLTDGEKALIQARLAAYEQDPQAGSSWAEVEARIRARLKA